MLHLYSIKVRCALVREAVLKTTAVTIFGDKSPLPHMLNDTAMAALIHWTRSASQDNVDSMVKVGDYYCECSTLSYGTLTRHETMA